MMDSLKRWWQRTPKLVRQLCVAVVGVIVVIAGIVMLVIPGPGWLAIFLGLAILSTEFIWADHLRAWIVHKFKSAFKAIKKKNSKK